MKNNKYLLFAFITFFGLCITSCKDMISAEQEPAEKVTVSAHVDFGDSSRMAVPQDYSLYDSLTYELTAMCNTEESLSKVLEFENAEILFALEPGNWSFTLDAKNGDEVILRSLENENIEVTEDTELSFVMKGIAYGTLKYSLLMEESKYDPDTQYDLINSPASFEVYKYTGSLATTLNGTKVTLNASNYSSVIRTEKQTFPSYSDDDAEKTYVAVYNDITFTLPEGKYIILCYVESKEGIRTFNFQDFAAVKAGLTTVSDYNDLDVVMPTNTITFHTDGGNFGTYSPAKEKVPNDCYVYAYSNLLTYFTILPQPEKAGAIFQGWYYDKELTKPVQNGAGDAFDISGITCSNVENVTAKGNFEVYAKWISGTKPEIMLFSSKVGEYGSTNECPVLTTNWDTRLNSMIANLDGSNYVPNAVDSIFIERNGQTKIVTLRSISTYKETSWVNSYYLMQVENNKGTDCVEINSGTPYKLAYNKDKDSILVLTKTEDSSDASAYWYASFYNYSADGKLKLKGSCQLTSDTNSMDLLALAYINDTIWSSFYYKENSDGNDFYSNYIYKHEVTWGQDSKPTANFKKKQNLTVSLNDSLEINETLKESTTLRDFALINNELYVTINVSTANDEARIVNNGTLAYYGAIAKMTDNESGNITLTPVLKSVPVKKELVLQDASANKYTYAYYGISSHRDASTLVGPTRFLAIKEDELVFADEGRFVWTTGNKAKYCDVNRVVVMNLRDNSIKYVSPVNYANFEGIKAEHSGDFPGGFVSNGCLTTKMLFDSRMD